MTASQPTMLAWIMQYGSCVVCDAPVTCWGSDDGGIEHAESCGLYRLIADLDRAEARVQELEEVHSVLAQFERQKERWKKPMPELDGENGVYVWMLKATEELGELSAALLGRLIGKEGRGDPLEEVDQLIAVLLRVRAALKGAP